MPTINCCNKCPDRKIGCHATCEKYIQAKANYEAAKAYDKAHRPPKLCNYDFDEIGHANSKRYRKKIREF